MDPPAPGTEDDLPPIQMSLTKQNNEQQRLLNLKAILPNGKYDHVFELSYNNGSEQWYCNACKCPVMGRVFQHEVGKRHTLNMQQTEEFKERYQPSEDLIDEPGIQVAPGEPLPPGFEGHVEKTTQIQERLDNFKVGPLVGLEYVLELQDYDPSKEPLYECVLCGKKGDPRTVLTHLSSYNHICQYLQKHFPTCYRKLAPYMTKQYKRSWQKVLVNVAEAIEQKFGRLRPFPAEKDKFEADRTYYLQIVSTSRHFSEKSGYSFEELIIHEELTQVYSDSDPPMSAPEAVPTLPLGQVSIARPFKKRSPSPPVVQRPSKQSKKLGPMSLPPPQNQPHQQRPLAPQNQSKHPPPMPTRPPPREPPPQLRNVPAQNRVPGRDIPPQGRDNRPQNSRNNAPPERGVNRDRSDRNERLRDRNPMMERGQRVPSEREIMRKREPAVPGTRRRSLSSVSSMSSSDLSGDEDRERRWPARGQQDRNRDFNRRGEPPSRPVHPRFQEPAPQKTMPWERPNYGGKGREKSPPPAKSTISREKLEEFKKLSKAIENDMAKTMSQHEKNPEKHPQYNEEWKKFWNFRYKELQAEGKDVQNHDFKPEWIQFWNKRMVEIHQEESKNRKDALRRRLGLPEEPQPVKFRIGGSGGREKSSPEPQKPIPVAAQPDHEDCMIVDPPKKRDVPKKDNRDNDRDLREQLKEKAREKAREMESKRRSDGSPWESDDDLPPLQAPTRNKSVVREKSKEKTPRARSMRRSRERSPDVRRRSRERSRRNSRDRSIEPRRRSSRDRSVELRRRSSRDRSPIDRFGRRIDRSPSRGQHSRHSRDRSRDRMVEKSRDYRESSFERDIRGRERVRTVADLPWEMQPQRSYYPEPPHYHPDYYGQPMMRDVSKYPPHMPPEIEDDEEVNIVSVLRLLTALEEKLGSLGPKVIDLLAQALALEKNAANSSEKLLDSDINCVLFETVKEKLKGQLLAGFVDMIQERAFKRAIQKTASLIHLAGERKKTRDQGKGKQVTPLTVPGVGAVDKGAIARQIANALIAQGKTDVTQDQLEQLINAVVGMAEASKKSGKPVSTASFLERIASGGAMNASNASTASETTIEPRTENKALSVVSGDNEISRSPAPSLKGLTEPLTPSPKPQSNMDDLSDSDLQTLLQNFKDLSTEEQHGLINYLKKLETHEPERVERLRKFVNLGGSSSEKEATKEESKLDKSDNKEVEESESETDEPTRRSDRESPFSNRTSSVNPTSDNKKVEQTIHLDSEEEDYSFEDIAKTVSSQIKAKEIEKERKLVEESLQKKQADFVDAQAIISNLMSNISKKTTPTTSSSVSTSSSDVPATKSNAPIITSNILVSSARVPVSSSSSSNVPVSTADLAKSLTNFPINMANIASIVGNAQKLFEQNKKEEFKEDFPPVSTASSSFVELNKAPSHDKTKGGIVLNRISSTNKQDMFDFSEEFVGNNRNEDSRPNLGANNRPLSFEAGNKQMGGMQGNIQPFGGNNQPFGGNNPPFGSNQQMGGNQQPFGGNNQPFGGNNQPFVGNNQPFGGNNQPFVGNPQMGGNQQIRGNQPPFGGNNQPFGGNNPAFGGNNQPFGGNNQQFAGNQPFGGNNRPFGGNQAPMGGFSGNKAPFVNQDRPAPFLNQERPAPFLNQERPAPFLNQERPAPFGNNQPLLGGRNNNFGPPQQNVTYPRPRFNNNNNRQGGGNFNRW